MTVHDCAYIVNTQASLQTRESTAEESEQKTKRPKGGNTESQELAETDRFCASLPV